jgi:hypothetical protein
MDKVKLYIVYWMAECQLSKRGWYTEKFHPRCKMFDDKISAQKLISKLNDCEVEKVPYQARFVSNISANWFREEV